MENNLLDRCQENLHSINTLFYFRLNPHATKYYIPINFINLFKSSSSPDICALDQQEGASRMQINRSFHLKVSIHGESLFWNCQRLLFISCFEMSSFRAKIFSLFGKYEEPRRPSICGTNSCSTDPTSKPNSNNNLYPGSPVVSFPRDPHLWRWWFPKSPASLHLLR